MGRVWSIVPTWIIRALAADDDPVFPPHQAGVDRVRQSSSYPFADHQTINDDFDGVALRPGQANWFRPGQFEDFSVNPDPNEPFPLDFFEHVPEFSRLVSDDRSDDQNACFFGVGQNLVDNLLWRLLEDLFSGNRIVGLSNDGKHNPEIVVNLCRGRDG